MKWIISLLAMLGLTGCETTQHSAIQPTDLTGIKTSVVSASEGVTRSSSIASEVLKTGAKPGDSRIKALALQLTAIQKDLAQARKDIDDKQKQITKVTADMNKVVDRLNYLEPKYAAAVGILWKWRLIAIGSWVAMACFVLFRGWIKAHIPFLGAWL